jgi:hypothetical protein
LTLRHLNRQKERERTLVRAQEKRAAFLPIIYGGNDKAELDKIEMERARLELDGEKLEYQKSLLDYQRELADIDEESLDRIRVLAGRQAKRDIKSPKRLTKDIRIKKPT